MTYHEPARPTHDRPRSIGVIGIGYTGLPLAVAFAAAGVPVTCYDIDEAKVDAVKRRRSYLPDVTDDELISLGGRLTATNDPDPLSTVDSVVICVPTPLTRAGEPDLHFVNASLDLLGERLRPGMLVVLQSTAPPGTTTAAADRLAECSGLRPGKDFNLAYSPERIDPANKHGWRLANTPKLVGGLTRECTTRARRLLELVCTKVVPVSSPEVAETAKVFENTFRLVNIALTYELADLCRGLRIPVREVIAAASTKPFGFLPHWPGPGVGGECIAVDPLFLQAVAPRAAARLPLLEAAYLHVLRRPIQVVDRLEALLRDAGSDLSGSRVLVVGVAYKPGVPDTRNSPALGVIRELRRRQAKPTYTDPIVGDLVVDGEAVPRVEWERDAVAAHDCLVLITPHEEIMKRPLWYAAPLLLDTWQLVHSGDGVAHL
ncbi:UDP-N-acetyl-D-glucosamine dehydrogenase [Longimycelium tulufanense]|uniref:UDP-N-acetyl-D-glucosamine dehydrogenase n=1 Tax=Longimycelium tulufanense TaxID=907463 RepID=A0A8J3CIE7_9PSEU|nr:nucleotide sugar dehydrogenase [Longimycelium tulufanense]GGM80534.1 UDP-N-acetyl-D-glucosamine dehydrogenase [Longimycelium tulufanense]